MRVEKELSVNAPVDRVYGLWTDFENFPRFMKHVDSVRATGDQTYHWKARFGPRAVEWDAKVVGMVPNRSVTWRSTSGAENAGAVNLAAQGNVTLMQVVIEYHPSWFEGLVATVSGEMSRAVEADLDNFKRLAEGMDGEAGATARMSADKAANVPTGADATGQEKPASVQGTTSQSIGAGNTGTVGPSAQRAGSQTSGATGASAGSTGASSANAGAGSSGGGASSTGDQDQLSQYGSRPSESADMGAGAPPPAWARSGQMQGGHEGGGEYATGGASTGSMGGTSRSGSFGPDSPVPGAATGAGGAEVVSGAAAGSGGAGTDLAGQAGNRGADSMDFSTRSGEREHASGAPPVDETAGTTAPVPVSGSHHSYGGTDITPTSGAPGYSAELSRSTEPEAGTGARGSALQTGDDNDAGGVSRAMDSGSASGTDSTTGGGSVGGATSESPGRAQDVAESLDPTAATAGGPDAGVSPQQAEAGGAMGPSLYSNEAAGFATSDQPLPDATSGSPAGNTGVAGTQYAPSSGGMSAASGGRNPDGDLSGNAGSNAAGVGTAGQTSGAISGGMNAGAARPIDVERGTPGLSGGTGGWGSTTGGEPGGSTSGGGATGGSTGGGLAGSSATGGATGGAGGSVAGGATGGASASQAVGDLEAGSGIGGSATGDVGQEVGLPAASTPDLNTGNVPTGSGPSMGPSGMGTGSTSTTAPGS